MFYVNKNYFSSAASTLCMIWDDGAIGDGIIPMRSNWKSPNLDETIAFLWYMDYFYIHNDQHYRIFELYLKDGLKL